MSRGFVVGVIAGGIAVWLWRDAMLRYADAKTRPVRIKAADKLRLLQRKAEGLADAAKEQISATLETTREAILPPDEQERPRPPSIGKAHSDPGRRVGSPESF